MNRSGRPPGHRAAASMAAVVIALLVMAGCGLVDSGGTDPSGAGARAGGGAGAGAATVTKVVDGDTVRVRLGSVEERVRLLGIDTPETRGPRGLRECFGPEATERLVSLLPPGTPVRLVRDVEPRDRYGRLLAYVYRLPDDLFVNLTLAQEGYAGDLVYPPNVAHADALRRASADARQARRGMWGRCRPP